MISVCLSINLGCTMVTLGTEETRMWKMGISHFFPSVYPRLLGGQINPQYHVNNSTELEQNHRDRQDSGCPMSLGPCAKGHTLHTVEVPRELFGHHVLLLHASMQRLK